jgi:arylsulfatase A-like enzyme
MVKLSGVQCAVFIVLAWGLSPAQGMSDERPNILLLMAEDMSARVGAFGDALAVTPNIDRLALEGVRYPNTFTTAGVCAPSRAAHIMGAHQNSFGAQHMRAASSHWPLQYQAVPPPDMKAYPELLRRAGYFTFVTSKLDYQFSGTSLGSGPFTIWDSETRAPFPWHEVPDDTPFFGFMTFLETHESGLFPRWRWPDSIPDMILQALHIYLNWGVDDVVTPDSVTVPPYLPAVEPVRRDIARHYNNIHTMDLRVGEVLARLQADGLAENTIVIWTTDHGDGLPRAKRELFDSGIRVPLIIRWPERYRPPNVAPGTIDERLVSFVDIAPTILGMAGVDLPAYVVGRAFAGPLADVPNRYVYAARDRVDSQVDRQRSVRDARYKYILNGYPGTPGAVHLDFRDQLESMRALWKLHAADQLTPAQALWFQPRPLEQLYDTQHDPHELHNLAQDPAHAPVLQRMRAALADWQGQSTDWGALPEEDMVRQFWPDLEQPKTAMPAFSYDAQGRVLVHSATEGASLGIRVDDGPWQLYTGPVQLAAGASLTAKAVRYGWQESEEAALP